VVLANIDEDRLLERLVKSSKHNLLNIPARSKGDIVHVELGLALKKIITVVCCASGRFVKQEQW